MYPSLIIWSRDLYGFGDSGRKAEPEPQSRFWYEGTLSWTSHIVGNPRFAPLDTYELDMTFAVWYPENTAFEKVEEVTPYLLFSDPNDYFEWHYLIQPHTTSERGTTMINVRISLERTPKTIMWAVTAMFFVQAVTIMLDGKKYFRERVSIYMALFVFTVPLFEYIQAKQFPPLSMTGVDTLFIFGVLSNSAMLAFSILGRIAVDEFHRDSLNILLDAAGVILVVSLLWFLPVYETRYVRVMLSDYLRDYVWWFIVPLILGLVVSVGFYCRRKQRKYEWW